MSQKDNAVTDMQLDTKTMEGVDKHFSTSISLHSRASHRDVMSEKVAHRA